MKQRKILKHYKKEFNKIVCKYHLYTTLDISEISDKECVTDLYILANLVKKKQVKKIKEFLENYSFFSLLEDLVCYYTSNEYVLNNYSLYNDRLRK